MHFIKHQCPKRPTATEVDRAIASGDYLIQPKHNGWRGWVTRDGLLTKRDNTIRIPHLAAHLEPRFLLDTELVVLGEPSTSWAVSHYLANDKTKLGLVVLDVLAAGSRRFFNRTTQDRVELLKRLWRHLEAPGVRMVQTFDPKRVDLERVPDGCDGWVLKKKTGLYRPGSKCADWLKVKKWFTYDVVIVDCDGEPTKWTTRPGELDCHGVLQPDGVYASGWKKGYVNLRYGLYDSSGRLRLLGQLGKTGPRQKLEQLVGRVAEVRALGQTRTGALTSPHIEGWRDPRDKAAEDCTFDFAE